MRRVRRTPGPPPHTTRTGRLAPYDAPHERQAGRELQRELAMVEGMYHITSAALSLSSQLHRQDMRDMGFPSRNPLNIGESA